MSYNANLTIDGHAITGDWDEALERLSHERVIGFDLETGPAPGGHGYDAFSPWRGKIATVQFYGEETNTLHMSHIAGGRMPDSMVRFFENPDHIFVGHNITNFDLPYLYTHGVNPWKARFYDTMVGEQVITPRGRKNVKFSLAAALKRRFKIELLKDIDHSWMNEDLTDEQVYYALRDVLHLPRLRRVHGGLAQNNGQFEALKFETEELAPVVLRMIINGMPIDLDRLEEQVEVARLAMRTHFATLKETSDNAFHDGMNMNSHVQVKAALLEATGRKWPKSGKDHLKFGYIDAVAAGDRRQATMLRALIDYREASQRVKMYGGDFVTKWVDDGVVRAGLRQCGADTTRFTSSNPNIQQTPVDFRKVYGWRPGLKVVREDYSAIEVVISAMISGDEALKAALRTADFHSTVASQSLGVPVEDVTPEQRQMAKTMSFNLMFAGGKKLLYNESILAGSTITRQQSDRNYDAFFRAFPQLENAKMSAILRAKHDRQVWITLPNGARRLLVGNDLKPTTILNTAVQGSAGVGLKYGLVNAAKRGLDVHLGTTIHDEIVAPWVPADEAEDYAQELSEAMIDGMSLIAERDLVKVGINIEDYWAK